MMVPEPEILILMLLTAFPREGVQVQGNKAMDPNDKNRYKERFCLGNKAQLQC